MTSCVSEQSTVNWLESSVGLSSSTPSSGSCCQAQVCAIPCPADWSSKAPLTTYGWATVVSILIVTCVGIAAVTCIKGKKENFFVGGRSMSLLFIATMLTSQALDSNASLGNADMSYAFAFWDGAVLPIGLTISLVLNAIFFARYINRAYCLTLPDFYGRAYGPAVEVIVALICMASFIALLAGNLVGMGRILQFCFSAGGLSTTGWVFLTGTITLIYTSTGGLFSVAYTDMVQASLGFTALVVAACYGLYNYHPQVPPPSIGFNGYSYPTQDICDMYHGVPGTDQPTFCVFNQNYWGTDHVDNGAYPLGDKKVNEKGMSSFSAYEPFPNAVYYNWATLFILGFGNLAALDFQVRCMAARSPKVATWGNLIAAAATLTVGILFSYVGGFMREHYGPDSPYAEFSANTCSQQLGLPSCAQWLPDEFAYMKLATSNMPIWIGAWSFIGIVAASMSTSCGAILAVGTVVSHNIGRRILRAIWPEMVIDDRHLLMIVRASLIPVTFAAACVAAFYNETGKLLVVAFDIVLAGCICILFAAVYGRNFVTPGGALASVLSGSILRVILQFTLPKDGSLVLPVGDWAYGYGAAQKGLPAFFDVPDDEMWDPSTCDQPQLKDFSGLDSIVSPFFSLIVMLLWSWIERRRDRTLWTFLPASWLEPVPPPPEVVASIMEAKGQPVLGPVSTAKSAAMFPHDAADHEGPYPTAPLDVSRLPPAKDAEEEAKTANLKF